MTHCCAVLPRYFAGALAKLEGLSLQTPPTRGRKFYIALVCYAGIAALAAFTLDGKFRLAVWVFLGYLAFRTYLHTMQKP
ncbi:MAG TPA: hypothetical protein VKX49_04590 [Bryobacteraceae bacterium]|nr:hypothetical protein [Bryobacteraceae bacterium]